MTAPTLPRSRMQSPSGVPLAPPKSSARIANGGAELNGAGLLPPLRSPPARAMRTSRPDKVLSKPPSNDIIAASGTAHPATQVLSKVPGDEIIRHRLPPIPAADHTREPVTVRAGRVRPCRFDP